MLHKTTDKDFFRDDTSGALINTNVSAYKAYKQHRESSKTISDLNSTIDSLKSEVDELKTLLYKVLEEKNNG